MLLFISAALLQASFLGFWFSLIDVANSLSAVNILTICGAVLAYRRRRGCPGIQSLKTWNILKILGSEKRLAIRQPPWSSSRTSGSPLLWLQFWPGAVLLRPPAGAPVRRPRLPGSCTPGTASAPPVSRCHLPPVPPWGRGLQPHPILQAYYL